MEEEEYEKDLQNDTKMKKQSTVETVLRAADHVSPLHVSEMPQFIGLTLLALLIVAYATSFLYLLVDMFTNCTEANNCVQCAVTVGQVEGSTCTNLPVTDLNIAAGCVKYTMENKYQDVKDLMDTLHENILPFEQVLPTSLYNSLTRHYKAVEMLNQNSKGMLVDPTKEQIESFINENHYYFGTSDAFAFDVDSNDAVVLDDSNIKQATAYALKIIYSYIGNGCTVYSGLLNGQVPIQYTPDFFTDTGSGGLSYPAYTAGGSTTAVDTDSGTTSDANVGKTCIKNGETDETTLSIANDVNYNMWDFSMTVIQPCGCALSCPALPSGKEIIGTISIGDMEDGTVDTTYKHGLGDYVLGVQNNYLQIPSSCQIPEEPFRDELASFEFMRIDAKEAAIINGGAGTSTNVRPQHCPGASVFTSVPSSLNSVLYECCTEKNTVEKLSEVSAFSSLIFTFVIIGTTFLFMPFDPSASFKDLCTDSLENGAEAVMEGDDQ